MRLKLLHRVSLKLTPYALLCLASFALKAVPACAICHTLNDAGSEGAVGPVLDEIKPSAERVAKALSNGLGSMPSFRANLSDSQIEALARYVSKASGGAP